jgi:hypothetical protein
MSDNSGNQGNTKGNQFFFNPQEVSNFYNFSDFALSARGKKLVSDLKQTPIGAYLVGFAELIDPIIAFEDIPFFSLYVPSDINLEAADDNAPQGVENSDTPVLLFDIETADERIFPFLVAGQLFRLLQDLSDQEIGSRIIPMMQHTICYNPVIRIDSENMFTKDYADMERACDVVALAALYQMRQNGSDMNSFGYMRAQKDYTTICDSIAQTGAFTSKSGVEEQDPELARDLLLYMGHMASRQVVDYNSALNRSALKAYEETMQNPGFEALAQAEEQAYSNGDDWDDELDDWDDDEFDGDAIDFNDLDDEQKEEIIRQIREEYGDNVEIVDLEGDDYGEGYNPPPFNVFHYALVSDTYEKRKWEQSQWIEIVNDFLMKENEDRAFRITEAFKMAADNKARREKDDYLNDKTDAPKPKGPKPPKK